MNRKTRKQLQTILNLIDASPDVTMWQVIRLLEARASLEDARESRIEMLAEVDDLEDPEQAQNWSAADEVESNRDATLDDPRDSIIFDAEAIDEMGRDFFGRKWTKAAK